MQFEMDGQRIFAATGGRPFDRAKPCIVFLHGAGCDHTFWALQTRYFAHHGWSVLALDLPGHGQTDGVPPVSIAMAVTWVSQVLAHLQIGPAILVGHSLGSLIALELAAQHPTKVSKLALLGAAVPMAVNAEFLELARLNDHKAIALMNDWSHTRRTHMGGARIPGLWIIGLGIRTVERSSPGVLYAGLNACNNYSPEQGYAAARQVACPVLMLMGERDLMAPAKLARRLGEKLRQVEYVTINNSGHMMVGERPDETLTALKRFIELSKK